MKVCQLLITNSAGGVAKHFIELTNALSGKVNTSAICPPSIDQAIVPDVQTIHFQYKKWHPEIYLTFKLYQLLRRNNFDIIHAHGNTSSRHLSRVRPYIRGKCIATVHWILKKDRERRIYHNLDAVIGVGDTVLDKIDNARRRVIYNGIPSNTLPLDAFEIRQKYRLPDRQKVAIAIGRLVKTKGFDTLIRAWKNVDATLLLVGDGPQRDDLSDLARELGIADRVIFAGQVDDAVSLFPAIDLVIVSSKHEGFGYVIAEALVHRKAIVSTSVDFARTVLPAELLAEPSNVSDLHQKICQALENIEQTRQRLNDSFDWASKHLLLENMVDNTIDFYRQVIDAD